GALVRRVAFVFRCLELERESPLESFGIGAGESIRARRGELLYLGVPLESGLRCAGVPGGISPRRVRGVQIPYSLPNEPSRNLSRVRLRFERSSFLFYLRQRQPSGERELRSFEPRSVLPRRIGLHC